MITSYECSLSELHKIRWFNYPCEPNIFGTISEIHIKHIYEHCLISTNTINTSIPIHT